MLLMVMLCISKGSLESMINKGLRQLCYTTLSWIVSTLLILY